jgi:hypothetical protein
LVFCFLALLVVPDLTGAVGVGPIGALKIERLG